MLKKLLAVMLAAIILFAFSAQAFALSEYIDTHMEVIQTTDWFGPLRTLWHSILSFINFLSVISENY